MVVRARQSAIGWLDRKSQAARRRDGEADFFGYRARRRDMLAARAYYAASAGLWRHRAASPGYLAAFLAGLDRCPAPRRVVDLGAGAGTSTAAVAERHPDARVVGIDVSRRMVRAATRAHTRPNLSFVRAGYRGLPVADRSIDLACMLNAVGDPVELRRVLAPGGRVLLASSFFELPPQAWFDRWREVGFEPLEAATAGGGHWEILARAVTEQPARR